MTKKLTFLFFAFFLFRLILSFTTWHPDVNNHIDWGIRFFDYGPRLFYAPEANVWSYTWPNQPPGTIYIYAGIRKLFEFVFGLFWTLNVKVPAFPSGIITFFESNLYPALLKLPSIAADIGIAYLIYRFILLIDKNEKSQRRNALFGSVLWLANPATWYNSAVWGQTDAVINFFVFLSLYLLYKKKLLWAVFALFVSIYIKISLLVFLPLFAILIFKQKYSIPKLAVSILLPLFAISLLTIPFSGINAPLWLFNLYQNRILGQQLHVITANAFNVWAFITGIHEQPNSLPFGPLSYQTWGNILFSLSYLPVLYLLWKKHDAKSAVWSFAIVAFSSFMLLTNMHERYLYPLFVYLTVIVAINRKLVLSYIIVSLINLLNLYNFWWVPKWEPVIAFMSFGDRLAPRLLGLVNFGIFGYLYAHFLRLFKAKDI